MPHRYAIGMIVLKVSDTRRQARQDGRDEYVCEVSLVDEDAEGTLSTNVALTPMKPGVSEQWALGAVEDWLDEMGLSEEEHMVSVRRVQKLVRSEIQLALLQRAG